MHLSRMRIENFRNFSDLDVALDGNIVIVGENRVGKSNMLFGLRLLLDPSLPDSTRQLGLSDFWDGLEKVDENTTIRISIEIKDFESDMDVLAMLSAWSTSIFSKPLWKKNPPKEKISRTLLFL